MFEELQQSLQNQLSRNPFNRGKQAAQKKVVNNDSMHQGPTLGQNANAMASSIMSANGQNSNAMANSIMSANFASSPAQQQNTFAANPSLMNSFSLPSPGQNVPFEHVLPPSQSFPSNQGLFDFIRNQNSFQPAPPSDVLAPPPPPARPVVVAPPPPFQLQPPPPPQTTNEIHEVAPAPPQALEGRAFLDAIRALRENGFNLDAAKKVAEDTQSATNVVSLLSSWKSKDEQQLPNSLNQVSGMVGGADQWPQSQPELQLQLQLTSEQSNPEQSVEQPRQRKRRGWDPEDEMALQSSVQQVSEPSSMKAQQWPHIDNNRRSRSKRRSHSRRRSHSGNRSGGRRENRKSRSRNRRQRSRSRRSLRRDTRDSREAREPRESRDTRDAERVRRQAGVPPVYETAPDHKEVSIPQKFTSRLIGKAGSKIAMIRQQSGADITVRYATPDNEFSKVVIVGPPSKVAKAEELIWETLGIEPGADVKEFEIPAEHVSAIIGPAGSNIAAMRAASGGIKIGVKIPDPPGSAPHKVWIGPALPEQIDIAVQLIQEKIKQNEGDLVTRLGSTSTGRLAQVPCKFFAQGSCKKGALCPFSHGQEQQAPAALEWQAPASESQTTEWSSAEWPAGQTGAHVPL